ncbi:CU044_5270 family protein [Actinomadura roseirufa]|uniref:CU044_5270 family protein n=1 Tax=Actinomadura roseirufa TaxID=2094049 RepID=UPI0010411FCE|nr:CU044_5270 family protein [Actinomadura roseirufa]
MNDVLKTLREARPDELDPALSVAEETRQAELGRAMTWSMAGGSAPAKRRVVRPVWGLGLVGAAAAAALVVTALPSGGGDAKDKAEAGAAPERLDARTILVAAAEKIEKEPDALSAYWHNTTIGHQYFTVPGGGYSVVDRQKNEGWTPSRPGGKAVSRVQNLGATPVTAADKAAWKRAGAPTTFKLKVRGSGGTDKPYPASTSAGPVQSSSSPVAGGKPFWIGHNVSLKELRDLPADPASLKKELLRWYKGHDTESTGTPATADAWLYTVGGNVAVNLPVTSKVRAAAFRLLADLKSVEGIAKVKDAEGRVGSAVALNTQTPRGLVQHRLIIDRTTGKALADEHILLKPASADDRPAGSLISSDTVITTNWTDSVS